MSTQPEKWKIRQSLKGLFVCVDGSPVGIPQEVCRVYNCTHAKQRAQLISSVPELLEALEKLVVSRTGDDNPAIRRAVAAIAKAKGETK